MTPWCLKNKTLYSANDGQAKSSILGPANANHWPLCQTKSAKVPFSLRQVMSPSLNFRPMIQSQSVVTVCPISTTPTIKTITKILQTETKQVINSESTRNTEKSQLDWKQVSDTDRQREDLSSEYSRRGPPGVPGPSPVLLGRLPGQRMVDTRCVYLYPPCSPSRSTVSQSIRKIETAIAPDF
jgi:hypothetical protein